MNIHNVSFTISAVTPKQYPTTFVPELAFSGRSNVGKSSLINRLLNRKNLARVSQKPGKTATINFYNIDDVMNFVDLPGYGFAKVSKEEKKKWGIIIDTYLKARTKLTQVILLVDSRHLPSEEDKVMMNYIRSVCSRAVVIATKCDKLKKSELEGKMLDIIKTLQLSGDDVIIPFSIVNGMGVEEFWSYVGEVTGINEIIGVE